MHKARKPSKHHFYWPKAKFPSKWYRSHHIWLPYQVHMAYHHYFMRECRKKPKSRTCHKEFCRYEGICCYCKTYDSF